MVTSAKLTKLLGMVALFLVASPTWGQTVSLPEVRGSWEPATSRPSETDLVPVQATTQPSLGSGPSASFGQPTFDPYATSPNAANSPPSLAPGGYGSATAPSWQTPGTVQPGTMFPNTGVPSGFPQQPPVLFPNGCALNTPNWNASGWNSSGWNWPQPEPGRYMRLFQDVRLRHTWLDGNNATDQMMTHDSEVGTTLNWPNFMFSGVPLQVSPVFIFHAWDGPDWSLAEFPTELPSRAYSAYLDFGWNPMITPHFGAEVNASFGIYSDFDSITNDSARFQGRGVFVLHLTPTVTVKGGIVYLDRVDKKLLPAGGILWQPDPNTRFDIFFPRPKLSKYLWTVGNTPVWGYVAGEYGGGSWTIQRAAVTGYTVPPNPTPIMGSVKDRVDINDIRVGAGLEWTHQSGLTAFFEVAYVWNRQLYFEQPLVYATGTSQAHDLGETIMLRGGLVY